MNKYEQANLEAEYNKRKELLKDLPLSMIFEMAADCSKETGEEIRDFLTLIILGENLDLINQDY